MTVLVHPKKKKKQERRIKKAVNQSKTAAIYVWVPPPFRQRGLLQTYTSLSCHSAEPHTFHSKTVSFDSCYKYYEYLGCPVIFIWQSLKHKEPAIKKKKKACIITWTAAEITSGCPSNAKMVSKCTRIQLNFIWIGSRICNCLIINLHSSLSPLPF